MKRVLRWLPPSGGCLFNVHGTARDKYDPVDIGSFLCATFFMNVGILESNEAEVISIWEVLECVHFSHHTIVRE